MLNITEYKRAWKIANRDKVRAYQKTYARRHSEKIKEFQKRWKLKNPDKLKIYRKKNKQSRVWMRKIADRDGEYCRNCLTSENLTLNHIKPKLIGGKYSYENLEIMCKRCNIRAYRDICKVALQFYFEKN